MRIKVISINEENKSVKISFNNSVFSAIWGEYNLPIVKKEYEVEIDINDNLEWGKNINFTNNTTENIYYKDNYIYIVCKLKHYLKDTYILYFYNNIIQVEITGIENDILEKWVIVKCTNIYIYNSNI